MPAVPGEDATARAVPWHVVPFSQFWLKFPCVDATARYKPRGIKPDVRESNMTLQAFFGRRWVQVCGVAAAATTGYLLGLTTERATAQPPGTLPAPAPAPDKRVVAYIYGNVPVTREELGDFLIARGGYEKLEFLISKKIVEVEAAKRNITVTATEVEVALNEDLRSLNMDKAGFVKHVLPRYNKTLYEWCEDALKPRILLGKMCRDRVKVSDEDLRRAFENRHGEKRQAKIIGWNKGDERIAQKQWDEARKGETQADRDVNFDRVARMQSDPNLAAACGMVAPIGRYTEAESDTVEKVLFSLKVGEMSQLFETPAGIMCVKCVGIIEPDKTVTLEKVRTNLEREVFERKMDTERPKLFNELKKLAQPNLLLKGPPSSKEFREGVLQGIQQTGGAPMPPAPGTPPATTTTPPPAPPKP